MTTVVLCLLAWLPVSVIVSLLWGRFVAVGQGRDVNGMGVVRG